LLKPIFGSAELEQPQDGASTSLHQLLTSNSNSTAPVTKWDVNTDRMLDTARLLQALTPPRGTQWRVLEIGGHDFSDEALHNDWFYETIDLEKAQNTGTGGYRGDTTTRQYNGRNLPYEKGSFDIVVVGFVLHHAGQNTLGLLQQIRQIATSHVLIGEDLSSLEYPLKWHERNHEHQPGGIYRSDQEWRQLFELQGWTVEHVYWIQNKKYLFWTPASDEEYAANMYRALYLLKPS